MLAQQIRRLRVCGSIDEIMIATTDNISDDPIAELAMQEAVGCFRGSEEDVLGRYLGAAQQTRADVIVRVTADCPLIDAGVTDRVINELLAHAGECDYATNVIERTYPRGLDVEAFFADTLFRLGRLSKSQLSREHVTVFLRAEHPELFLIRHVKDVQNNAELRWTVDTPLDLQVVREIYRSLGLGERCVPYAEILAYVRSHPRLAEMNAHVETWAPGH